MALQLIHLLFTEASSEMVSRIAGCQEAIFEEGKLAEKAWGYTTTGQKGSGNRSDGVIPAHLKRLVHRSGERHNSECLQASVETGGNCKDLTCTSASGVGDHVNIDGFIKH